MIDNFYTKEGTIYRREYGEDNKTTKTEVESFGCHLQDADPEVSETLGMRHTKAKEMWCDIDTDIKDEDEVEIGSNKYKVRGILNRDYSYCSQNDHKKVYLEQV